jgi:hypothetical protein
MKKNNPSIPIMLRDAAGTPPKVYARYGTWTSMDSRRRMHAYGFNYRVWKGD